MTDKTDDNDNVIKLPGLVKKPTEENITIPVNKKDDNVIDFSQTVREKEKEDIEAYKSQAKKDANEIQTLRQKVGMMISINEMLKIQLSDLITQLDFMDQHIRITKQNAKNMLVKLPKITEMDLPLPPKN